jgi:hypothetical protein
MGMSRRHTHGPWTRVSIPAPGRRGNCWRIETAREGKPIASVLAEGSEDHKNAALIAAAPDLLEALRACVAWHREEPAADPLCWVRAESVIAAAEDR